MMVAVAVVTAVAVALSTAVIGSARVARAERAREALTMAADGRAPSESGCRPPAMECTLWVGTSNTD